MCVHGDGSYLHATLHKASGGPSPAHILSLESSVWSREGCQACCSGCWGCAEPEAPEPVT